MNGGAFDPAYPIATRRRTSTYAPTSANTRLRQPVARIFARPNVALDGVGRRRPDFAKRARGKVCA
jgi:hypothetical protein